MLFPCVPRRRRLSEADLRLEISSPQRVEHVCHIGEDSSWGPLWSFFPVDFKEPSLPAGKALPPAVKGPYTKDDISPPYNFKHVDHVGLGPQIIPEHR